MLKPSAVSRSKVCVALRVITSTSPDWSATKRCCEVVGVNLTLSASPNIATAIALQRSTSRPVHLPWLSEKEKPASPVLTAHCTKPLAFTASKVWPADTGRAVTAPTPKRTAAAVRCLKIIGAPSLLTAGTVAKGAPTAPLEGPLDHQLLDLGDRLGRIEALGTGLGAVHDRVAAIEPERVLELVEALALGFVAAVGDPAIGLQQDGRAEIAVAAPPVAGARSRAAEAQDALPQPVELGALLGRLQALARRRLGGRLQPRLDLGELGVGHGEVGYQILHHRHVRQRVDLDVALHVGNIFRAGQRIGAVDIHRTRAAHAFAARATEGERTVDLVLDLDQRVEDHRAGGVHVDFVGVERWLLAIVGRPAIDLELPDVLGAVRRLVGHADADLGIGGQCKLSHRFLSNSIDVRLSKHGLLAGTTERRCSSAAG